MSVAEERAKAQELVDQIPNLTSAYDVLFAMEKKFGLSMTVFAVQDCWVQYDGETCTIGEAEADGVITQEMKEMITGDKQWYRWLSESLAETGSRQLPTLVIDGDGDYQVIW